MSGGSFSAPMWPVRRYLPTTTNSLTLLLEFGLLTLLLESGLTYLRCGIRATMWAAHVARSGDVAGSSPGKSNSHAGFLAPGEDGAGGIYPMPAHSGGGGGDGGGGGGGGGGGSEGAPAESAADSPTATARRADGRRSTRLAQASDPRVVALMGGAALPRTVAEMREQVGGNDPRENNPRENNPTRENNPREKEGRPEPLVEPLAHNARALLPCCHSLRLALLTAALLCVALARNTALSIVLTT